MGVEGAIICDEDDGDRGSVIANETCKDQRQRYTEDGVEVSRTFQFLLPYDWHYRFRHSVDDHYNVRHSLPLVEGTL